MMEVAFKDDFIRCEYFEAKINSGVKMVRDAEEDLKLEPKVLGDSKRNGGMGAWIVRFWTCVCHWVTVALLFLSCVVFCCMGTR